MHGKRRVVEPNGTLSAHDLANGVCETFNCSNHGCPALDFDYTAVYAAVQKQ